MRLPENGRLFVGGIPPGTGNTDLRRHFSRYGEVADICLPMNHLTGRPRCFAFVQFLRHSDAGRALTDPHHVINGRQVHIGRAEPKQAKYRTPLCHRIYRIGKFRYKVGDMVKITIGPLSDNYRENKYVKELWKFGVIIDKILIFDCIIGYISEDGKECLVRWPPVQRGDKSARSGEGSIIPACDFPLKDLAQFLSSGNVASNRFVGESSANSHDTDGSKSWCWLMC